MLANKQVGKQAKPKIYGLGSSLNTKSKSLPQLTLFPPKRSNAQATQATQATLAAKTAKTAKAA